MKNAEWMIKNGMEFSRLSWGHVNGRNVVYYETGKHFEEQKEPLASSKELYTEKSAAVKNLITKWLDMEHKEPILDETERQYLECVLRPLPKVKCIRKIDTVIGEYLRVIFETISLTADDYTLNDELRFPYFKTGTMYTGMISRKDYTPKELGLKGLK